MKRRRDSTVSNAKRRSNRAGKGKASHIQINYSGPSFSDLPDNILVTILLGLSVKSIFVCKCVCKTWYDLISDPDFAKLHFNQAQVYPLLPTSGFTLLSRMLYLVQPEQVDFQRMRDMRYDYNSPVKIKLDCKLKLPLRNIQTILDKDGVDGVDVKNCMKLDMKDHKYNIVNSCNGLLCLSNPSDNDPVVVCNPVTGEFINLPVVRMVNNERTWYRGAYCGFGFSPVTNQYKVIRMFRRWTGLPSQYITVAEVHTLGTETWRVLSPLRESTYVKFPTYLDRRVYWLKYERTYSVKSFDIEKECIESISVPWNSSNYNDRVSIGVLGGELFISAFQFGDDILRFWVMKDNGSNKSWSQIFSFDERLRYGLYQPIMYLNNGALLMFKSDERALICEDPRKCTGFRYLKIRGFDSQVEAIAHIPSFVPLKHALSGHDVEVLNVNSRCAELKLHREGKCISLVEKDGEWSTE